VRIIYVEGAGCYGRNGHEDAAGDAVLLSRAVGAPVRVQWMREQEHGGAPMGPAQVVDVQAMVAGGRIHAWRCESWLTEQPQQLPPVHLPAFRAVGAAQVESSFSGYIHANQQPGYAIPHQQVVAHRSARRPVRTSWIRGPGRVINVFAVESVMDQLARAGGVDPLEFRLAHAPDERSKAVMRRVAALAKWREPAAASTPGAEGTLAQGRGFAYSRYSNNSTYVAMVADVTVDRATGVVRLLRMFASHDCGFMVNPDGVRNQVEGSIVQTASRGLYEEMAFDGSRVTSTDWASYPIMRFADSPEMVIDLVPSSEPPMGAGEASTAPVVAAIANAIFDAVGVRLMQAPFTPPRVLAALQVLPAAAAKA
jgi:nicotinate dehydrogenase subunit B